MSVVEGATFVAYAADICEQLGYSVFVPSRETCGPWDMIVNGKRVQVKKRGVCTSQPNRIRLRTSQGPATTAYNAIDVDAFAVFWKLQWYVFDSAVVARDDGSIRNGIYMPDVAEWINRWDVLSGESVIYSKQKEFDF